MSSDEKTYYNIRRLHLAFAIAALMLLATTVWMLATDHRRQWKGFQQTYRDQVEPWMTEAKLLQQQQAAAETDEQHQETLHRLKAELESQTPGMAERFLRLPIIDALGRSLAIEQIWLPELTIDYNFSRVARFDRCVTCHQGIDRTLIGNPSQAAFPPEKLVEIDMPRSSSATGGTLQEAYGFSLTSRGILEKLAPTVGLVLPLTPAAMARLAVGDAIVQIDGLAVADAEDVKRLLLEEHGSDGTIKLIVRRGLPEPYCGHPRLDLMVGSSSPHPMGQFGCTICHDGQGSATDFRWASHSPNDVGQGDEWRRKHGWSRNPHWDFPMLPSRFAQSRCLKCHHEVVDLDPGRRFPDPPAAKLVEGYRLVRRNGCFGCHEIKGIDAAGRSIGPDLRIANDEMQAAEASRLGLVNKVGPNLRYAVGRMDRNFMAEVIDNPTAFRAGSRMPRLFGLHEHLDKSQAARTKQLEAVEVRGIVEYLLANGEEIRPPQPPEVTEEPSIRRGRRVFRTQGCLACHQHDEFPNAQSVQGADLSELGAKYTTSAGREWLSGWIRNPAHFWPKTLMPNPLLKPEPLIEETSERLAAVDGVSKTVDPAADVAAFLLSFKEDYQPAKLPDVDESVLDELLDSYPGEPSAASLGTDGKLEAVGRLAIGRRGCYGCHEIRGFADAKPIGPSLSDWGRKLESLLAFEKIDHYIRKSSSTKKVEERVPCPRKRGHVEPPHIHAHASVGMAPEPQTSNAQDVDRDFYVDALLSRRRAGFIWQKLREPRSFDFRATERKGYHERLTMGRFEFTPKQREAIITFVLGLVADPPAGKYVYQPDPRRRAVIEGRKVIDKYGCAECHTLRPQQWAFDFNPKLFADPPPAENFDFVRPHFSDEQLAASRRVDDRGLGHAEVLGMPRVDDQGHLLEDEDDDGNPLYFFTLWQPAAINGKVWDVGGMELTISEPQLTSRREPVGGAFARLLHAIVIADARAAGTLAPTQEAWGWVPPPLFGEGAKVRAAWLREYLLDPNRIRPAAVLRMPRFGMSAAEAAKLADYFAAEAEPDRPSYSRPSDTSRRQLDGAMRILVDGKTFCAKCHGLGDYEPNSETRTTLAPNLLGVRDRIQPGYLRRWLGNPRSILPYTAMPVNFPPAGTPLGQDIFPGTSVEQLDAVMVLLLEFDEYLRSKTSVRTVIGPTAEDK